MKQKHEVLTNLSLYTRTDNHLLPLVTRRAIFPVMKITIHSGAKAAVSILERKE